MGKQEKLKRILTMAATLITDLTYVEDSTRIVINWSNQARFIHRLSGMPKLLIPIPLMYTCLAQYSSLLLLVPDTATIPPAVMKFAPSKAQDVATCKLLVMAALAVSIVLQPIIYHQWDNVDFLCMSMSQLGALMLLAAASLRNSHSMIGYISRKTVPGNDTALLDQLKLGARFLLTMDFFAVY